MKVTELMNILWQNFTPTQGLKANILTHFCSSSLLLLVALFVFITFSPPHYLSFFPCLCSVCLPACSQYSVLQLCLQSSPLGTCSVRARDPTPSHMCAGTETRTFLSMTTCAWTRYQCGQNPSSNSHRHLNMKTSQIKIQFSSRVFLNYQNPSYIIFHSFYIMLRFNHLFKNT